MATSQATVFIVDDEAEIRTSIEWLVGSLNIPVESFAGAETFLRGYDVDRAGCLLCDVRMPGMSGLQLLAELNAKGSHLPVIILTSYGDVARAVAAMKAGAADFIEKPFDAQQLLDRIFHCFALDEERRQRDAEFADIVARFATLTAREHEVMEQLVAGCSSKAVARNLGISGRTVDVHRGRIMAKTGAGSIAALVRMSVTAGISKTTYGRRQSSQFRNR